MAIFKCKMCGNEIDSDKRGTNNVCEKCGARYALKPVKKELADLYDRADDLRRDCEFDSAESIYRDIISIDEKQADAYWGAVLCKYCVGCINDRDTHTRISICRGSSADSIKSDDDFLLAVEYGDDEQRSVYNSEADEIIRTQKEIFEIMSSEKPFDVFISYKETDANGKRTKDSFIADAIYNQFEKEGLKVFYAPVTLRGVDKIGRKYLTSIFAAVNSSKVMLAVGSKIEYFMAEWVKSEWSRFLELMKIDSSKKLIPCYLDMQAGDLPKGLKQLQAEDISSREMEVVNIVIEYLYPKKSIDSIIKFFLVFITFPVLILIIIIIICTVMTSNQTKLLLSETGTEVSVESENELPIKVDLDYFKEKAAWVNYLHFSKNRSELPVDTISAGISHVSGIKSDGTVITLGANEYGQCDTQNWKDIIAVSAGNGHTVGLKSDKTVIATGRNDYSQCDVSNWKGIISISAKYFCTVGLKSNGTVVAVGINSDGQCNVSDWKDIVAVSTGGCHTVGLKKDGTVVAVGWNEYGQCDVSEWTDIVAVSAGCYHTVGLKSDGTVVAVGLDDDSQGEVSEWKSIIAISAGTFQTIGLKSNGTVVSIGKNDIGQCDVSEWKNIVSVSAGNEYTVGLKSNGTVISVGNNQYGKGDVKDWTDIKTTK